MRWIARLEGRLKKKKAFGRDSIISFKPFYTTIHFSSKAPTTGNKHTKKYQEIAFTNYISTPVSPSPLLLLGTDTQYMKSCNHLEIYYFHCMAELFPGKAVYIFYKVEPKPTPFSSCRFPKSLLGGAATSGLVAVTWMVSLYRRAGAPRVFAAPLQHARVIADHRVSGTLSPMANLNARDV